MNKHKNVAEIFETVFFMLNHCNYSRKNVTIFQVCVQGFAFSSQENKLWEKYDHFEGYCCCASLVTDVYGMYTCHTICVNWKKRRRHLIMDNNQSVHNALKSTSYSYLVLRDKTSASILMSVYRMTTQMCRPAPYFQH